MDKVIPRQIRVTIFRRDLVEQLIQKEQRNNCHGGILESSYYSLIGSLLKIEIVLGVSAKICPICFRRFVCAIDVL